MPSTSRQWRKARCWRSSIWPRAPLKVTTVQGPLPTGTLAIIAKTGGDGWARALEGRAPRTTPMIRITETIAIDEREIEESFIRASGPGGQNVNKLSTAVQLRFDVRHSSALTEPVRARLARLAGKRLTKEGVLVITAQRHRTQERNRDDALARLIDLISRAAIAPTPRRKTRPTADDRKPGAATRRGQTPRENP